MYRGPAAGIAANYISYRQNLSCRFCRLHYQSMAGVQSLVIWRPSLRTLPGRRPTIVTERILILLFTYLFTIALACECFFHTFLLTWFQIKRMTLNFLDDVFGLHLALEAPQGILKGFAFLYSNLCQEKYTSKQSQSG